MAALSTSTAMGQAFKSRPRLVIACAVVAMAAGAMILGSGAIALLADTTAPATTSSGSNPGLMLQHVLRENGLATVTLPDARSLEQYRQHVLRENGLATVTLPDARSLEQYRQHVLRENDGADASP